MIAVIAAPIGSNLPQGTTIHPLVGDYPDFGSSRPAQSPQHPRLPRTIRAESPLRTGSRRWVSWPSRVTRTRTALSRASMISSAILNSRVSAAGPAPRADYHARVEPETGRSLTPAPGCLPRRKTGVKPRPVVSWSLNSSSRSPDKFRESAPTMHPAQIRLTDPTSLRTS